MVTPSMPLRTAIFAAPSHASPVKPQSVSQGDEEEDHIILVDGNHPRVVEDDKDLVILEDVEVPLVGTPMSTPTAATIPSPVPDTCTPAFPFAEHIASCGPDQERAVMQAESAEREREQEEEEEMEVLGAVAADIGSESENDDDVVMHNKLDDRDTVGGENDSESEGDDEEYDEEERGRGRGRETSKESQKSVWRKSLERIWPFRSSSPGPKEEIDEEEDQSVCCSQLPV
jgi:hypothetical protein